MRRYHFLGSVFWLCCLVLSVSSFSQDQDSSLPAWEVRVNKRQPPDIVLKTIGIKPGMIVGEVGAGSGRYTVQLASRIGPTGFIYANDIRPKALQSLEKRCKTLGFANVKTILGTVTETKLPHGALDLVIMVNVVHCLEKPVELLKNIRPSLKSDGFIAIVEGNLDKDPSALGEWFTRKKLIEIYKDAGYTLFREETFLPKDNIYFLKPE